MTWATTSGTGAGQESGGHTVAGLALKRPQGVSKAPCCFRFAHAEWGPDQDRYEALWTGLMRHDVWAAGAPLVPEAESHERERERDREAHSEPRPLPGDAAVAPHRRVRQRTGNGLGGTPDTGDTL